MTVDIRKVSPVFRNLSRTPGDWSKHVASMSISKTVSGNPGTFEISLAPFPDYDMDSITKEEIEGAVYSLIKPMDVIHIGMRWFNPETKRMEEYIPMWGIVDNVYKSKSQSGNGVRREIKIRGRDATKLMIEDNVVFAPLMAESAKLKEMFGDRVEFLNYIRGYVKGDDTRNVFLDSPAVDALYWVLRNMPATNVALESNGKVTGIRDYMMANLSSFKEDIILEPTLTQFSGSVMNYLRELVDEQFYELWVDTIPLTDHDSGEGSAVPVLIVRPKPFDFAWDVDNNGKPLSRWAGKQLGTNGIADVELPFFEDVVSPTLGKNVTVLEAEILSKDLGVSDYEVQTFYNLIASKDVIGANLFGTYGYWMSLLDVTAMKAYGVRPMQGSSRMFWGSFEATHDVVAAAAKNLSEGKLTSSGYVQWDIPNLGDANKDPNVGIAMDAFVQKRRDMLWRWNRYNQILESGTVTINGKPVSVGCKVEMPEEYSKGYVDPNGKLVKNQGMTFYCVGYTHRYQFGNTPAWTTSLNVIRGYNQDDLTAYAWGRKFDEPTALDTNGIMTVDKDVLFSGAGQ